MNETEMWKHSKPDARGTGLGEQNLLYSHTTIASFLIQSLKEKRRLLQAKKVTSIEILTSSG